MKKKYASSICKELYLVLILLFLTAHSYSQEKAKTIYSETFIKECIVEVFQDKADELVYNSKSKSLPLIKRFFNKRLEIKSIPNYSNSDVILLSSVPLFDKYNHNLVADITYNSETFNPLKYKLNFNEKVTLVYRIGSTDYFMFIHP